jgi:hypothetical protein
LLFNAHTRSYVPNTQLILSAQELSGNKGPAPFTLSFEIELNPLIGIVDEQMQMSFVIVATEFIAFLAVILAVVKLAHTMVLRFSVFRRGNRGGGGSSAIDNWKRRVHLLTSLLDGEQEANDGSREAVEMTSTLNVSSI